MANPPAPPRAKSVIRLPAKDRLNLHASLSPSSLPKSYKSALLDPNWAAAMKDEYDALPIQISFRANGFFAINLILMGVLHVIRLDGYAMVTLSNTASIMIRLSLQLSSPALFTMSLASSSLLPGEFIN